MIDALTLTDEEILNRYIEQSDRLQRDGIPAPQALPVNLSEIAPIVGD